MVQAGCQQPDAIIGECALAELIHNTQRSVAWARLAVAGQHRPTVVQVSIYSQVLATGIRHRCKDSSEC